jgi:stage II sporulation protein AA (anti-sigma F factor antagonist)
MRTSTDRTGTVTLTVAGEVDLATADALRQAITDLLQTDGIRRLVVDFAHISFLDAAGVAALVAGHRLGRAAGVGVKLVNCRPVVLRVLEIVGVDKLLITPLTRCAGSRGPVAR